MVVWSKGMKSLSVVGLINEASKYDAALITPTYLSNTSDVKMKDSHLTNLL